MINNLYFSLSIYNRQLAPQIRYTLLLSLSSSNFFFLTKKKKGVFFEMKNGQTDSLNKL